MNVAFYNHTSDVSGAEISLLLTARNLKGARPVLFAPEGELLERAREAGLAVMPVDSYRARMSKNPLRLAKDVFGMVKSGYRLSKAIRSQQVELIHANSLRAGIMASLFTWHHRLPVVWHVRDMLPKGIIGRAISSVARSSASALIGISHSVLEDFQRKVPKNKLHLIHNGVELREISEREGRYHRQTIREELATPQKSKVVAIIGQITPWKRQEDALEAVHMLAGKGHDVYLWVVGEAKFRQENLDYESSLRRRTEALGIQDRVRFTGFRKDIMEICCAADLLFLCSDNEPFGRVIIEAMSQGTPVVATDAGGVPDIIVSGENGLLYEVGNVNQLVHHADRLLQDDLYRARMGKNASERVKTHFTIDRTVQRVEAAYDAVLGGRVRPGKAIHTLPVPSSSSGPKVAIVHDYLNQMGGAERVVEVLHRMYPEAPIFTTIVDREKLLPELRDADIRTTWMQRIPGIQKRFKLFFWLYPFAMASMRLKGYDIVISSSSAYGKGAPVDEDAVHICYCHTPMRFAWDFASYMESVKVPALFKLGAKLLVGPLRIWDKATSKNVTQIIANSTVVKERIREHYGKNAPVIFPPVNVSRFQVDSEESEDYFLIVSRLVSYKRIDLAVEACTLTGKKLIVIGDGPDRSRLESLAGPSVTFMGRLPDDEVEWYMKRCQALLFPGFEDFGITPLEANACGKPVIAFRKGGALDTVISGLNGLFFEEQTVEALAAVLNHFHPAQFNTRLIRQHAESFEESRFMNELKAVVQGAATQRLEPALFGRATENH
jgi:glycosyltransferase involved in cell wall biosynthesis